MSRLQSLAEAWPLIEAAAWLLIDLDEGRPVEALDARREQLRDALSDFTGLPWTMPGEGDEGDDGKDDDDPDDGA